MNFGASFISGTEIPSKIKIFWVGLKIVSKDWYIFFMKWWTVVLIFCNRVSYNATMNATKRISIEYYLQSTLYIAQTKYVLGLNVSFQSSIFFFCVALFVFNCLRKNGHVRKNSRISPLTDDWRSHDTIHLEPEKSLPKIQFRVSLSVELFKTCSRAPFCACGLTWKLCRVTDGERGGKSVFEWEKTVEVSRILKKHCLKGKHKCFVCQEIDPLSFNFLFSGKIVAFINWFNDNLTLLTSYLTFQYSPWKKVIFPQIQPHF